MCTFASRRTRVLRNFITIFTFGLPVAAASANSLIGFNTGRD
jgi:hypothetical protein